MILDAAAPSWAAKRCNEITASFITILGPLVGTIGIQPNIFWYVQWRSTKEPCICRNSWEFASYPGSLPNRFEILSVGSYFSLPVMSKTSWQEKTGDMSYKNKSEYFSVPNGIFLKVQAGLCGMYRLTFTGVRGLALIFGADLGPEQMTQVTQHRAVKVTNVSSKCIKLHTNSGHDKAPGKSFILYMYVYYVIKGISASYI